MSTVEHLDFMIQSEKSEKQQGYFNRIKMLEEIKRLGQDIKNTRENMLTVMGKDLKPAKKKEKNKV